MAAANDLKADESAVLQRLLLQTMAPPQPSNWEQPPATLLRSAAVAYLLLDEQAPGGIGAFLGGGLERLARELSRKRVQQAVADDQGVRGRVLWSATVAARADRGDGGPTFVYHEVRHQYNTPENQLLRFVVEQLIEGVRQLPAPLRSAFCYTVTAGELRRSDAPGRLEQIQGALLRARSSAGLRSVSLPARVETEQLRCAETARNEAYGIVARLYRHYSALSHPERWRATLCQVARRTLILPAAPTPEAEPWFELAALALRQG